MDSFLRELKQRHVYRVAIGYAVVAWLVVQVGATILPAFQAPNWILRLLIVLLALGFPVILVLAFAFDANPKTLNRPPASRQHRWSLGLVGLLIAFLVVAATWFWIGPGRAGLTNVPEKSIAVLPFESLSDKAENAYFAEGIQDEILTRLARIADLKVISRTSTQRYKSSPENLRQIARELGVAHILEGTVQRVGDQVRVNVQLIKAANDSHLWAELYDRKLTDIFSVESEIAEAIAESLHAQLSGREKQALAVRPTENPQAHDAYLRGITAEARGLYSFEKEEQAARFFEEATRLDPQFAMAWARLCRAEAFLYFRRQDSTPARRSAVEHALARAKELQPEAVDTVLAEGYYRYWVLRDYERARTLFFRAAKLSPGTSDVPYALSAIARRQGRWDESLTQSQRALELSPRDLLLLTERAWTQKVIRHFDDALMTYDHALDIVPNDPDLLASKAAIYQAEGDLAAAGRIIEPLQSQVTEGAVANAVIAQSFLERHPQKAADQLRVLLANSESMSQSSREAYSIWLGLAQQLSGDSTNAHATYSKIRDTLEQQKVGDPGNEDLAASLSQAYAALGDKAHALSEAERAVRLMPASLDAVIGPGYEENLASIQAQVGEKERALSALEHLLVVPAINGTSIIDAPLTPARLRLEPTWDALRNDPRFTALLKR